MEEQENKRHFSLNNGLVFIGCMFIGVGIGMIFHAEEIGGAIGMGIGFIAMALNIALFKQK